MNLFETVAEVLASGRQAAVACLARRLGSAPRGRGARCAVLADGTTLGTIGGGVLEARVREAALDALDEGQVRYLTLRLDAKQLADEGMICGGSVDVLVVPWTPEQEPTARAAARLVAGAGRGVLLTAWRESGRAWQVGLWSEQGWVGATPQEEGLEVALEEARERGEPVLRGGAEAGVLAEPLFRERCQLLVLGAGHVGRALARAASLAGFAVTLVDDRPEFATPESAPEVDRVLCRPFDGVFQEADVDRETFVVICTRGHLADALCTEQAMATSAPYVGVIGSRHKRAATLDRLRAAGIPAERLRALRMPVGLPIEAETPEEIAVSVVAEMIRFRRSGFGGDAAEPGLPLEWDASRGRLSLQGQGYLLIPPETLGPMCRSRDVNVQRQLEDGGRRGGTLAAQAALEQGLEGRAAFEALLAKAGRLGWGRFRLDAWELERVSVTLESSPCAEAASPFPGPVCHPVRGTLAGMVERITGRPTLAEEVACAAWDDELCRFELRLGNREETSA